MFRAPHIILGWEWFPVFDWRGKPTFHKHLKRNLPSEIGMWEGLCVFYLKWNGPREALTQKKAGFPCSGLNAGSYFISQDEGMTESPMETLEKAIVLHHFWTEGLISFWHIERCLFFCPLSLWTLEVLSGVIVLLCTIYPLEILVMRVCGWWRI